MRLDNGWLRLIAACLLVGVSLNAVCSENGDDPDGDTNNGDILPTLGPLSLDQVGTWAYQIQNIADSGQVDALAASRYDMLVIEPTRTDWSDEETRDFDAKQMVDRLKNSAAGDGEHRKLVIAYIDIGEAEDWRWYWTWSTDYEVGDPIPADWPDYILTFDPDGWTGNYPVAYWDTRWKDIIIYGQNQDSAPYGDYTSVLDEVLNSGFDGVYLDWVEGYENEQVMTAASAAGLDPAGEMVRFIGEIRDYARQRNPSFLVIQQNAAALLEGHPELLDVIDAIAQEAVWFDGTSYDNWNDPDGADDPIDAELTEEYIGFLDSYLDAGLPVFNCEYAVQQADEAYQRGEQHGYVTYCTRRPLSRLTTTPPPGY